MEKMERDNGESPTLCWGCRVATDVPIGPDDALPTLGRWEKFTCERCGIEDVRRVRRG